MHHDANSGPLGDTACLRQTGARRLEHVAGLLLSPPADLPQGEGAQPPPPLLHHPSLAVDSVVLSVHPPQHVTSCAMNGRSRLINGQRRAMHGQGRLINGQRLAMNGRGLAMNGRGRLMNGQRRLINGRGRPMNGQGRPINTRRRAIHGQRRAINRQELAVFGWQHAVNRRQNPFSCKDLARATRPAIALAHSPSAITAPAFNFQPSTFNSSH